MKSVEYDFEENKTNNSDLQVQVNRKEFDNAYYEEEEAERVSYFSTDISDSSFTEEDDIGYKIPFRREEEIRYQERLLEAKEQELLIRETSLEIKDGLYIEREMNIKEKEELLEQRELELLEWQNQLTNQEGKNEYQIKNNMLHDNTGIGSTRGVKEDVIDKKKIIKHKRESCVIKLSEMSMGQEQLLSLIDTNEKEEECELFNAQNNDHSTILSSHDKNDDIYCLSVNIDECNDDMDNKKIQKTPNEYQSKIKVNSQTQVPEKKFILKEGMHHDAVDVQDLRQKEEDKSINSNNSVHSANGLYESSSFLTTKNILHDEIISDIQSFYIDNSDHAGIADVEDKVQVKMEELTLREEAVALRELAVSEREEALTKREKDIEHNRRELQNEIQEWNDSKQRQMFSANNATTKHCNNDGISARTLIDSNGSQSIKTTATRPPLAPSHLSQAQLKEEEDMANNFLKRLDTMRAQKSLKVEQKVRELEKREASIKRRYLFVENMEKQIKQQNDSSIQENNNSDNEINKSIFHHIGSFFNHNDKKPMQSSQSQDHNKENECRKLKIINEEEKASGMLLEKIKETERSISELKKEIKPWQYFQQSNDNTLQLQKLEKDLLQMNKQYDHKQKKLTLLKNHEKLKRNASANTEGMLNLFGIEI